MERSNCKIKKFILFLEMDPALFFKTFLIFYLKPALKKFFILSQNNLF